MKQIHFFSWDERRDIAHPGNKEKTLAFSIEHFLNCAKEGIKLHGYFSVALSGGSTPRAIFQALGQPPYADQIDWTKALLFWGDERQVPPTHPDSNFRMAIEAGFKNLPIPAHHILRMEAEGDLDANALRYEEKIKQTLGVRPFDLIMLGMGQDGHVASLFPDTAALEENKRWVVANHVQSKNTWRMTFTCPLINRGSNIAIYVLGKSKEKTVHKVFFEKNDPPLPAERIGTRENKALWILDTEAFGGLKQAKR